jgi:WD40 repeat protein
MFVLDTQGGDIHSLVFAPGGRLLGVIKPALGVSLWDLPEQKLRGNLVTTRPPFRLAFAPDGRTAAVGQRGINGTVSLCDLQTYRESAALVVGHGYLADLAYAPDGTDLVTAALNYGMGRANIEVRQWDLKTNQSRQALQCYLPYPNNYLSLFVGDAVSLAVGGYTGSVTICSPGKRNVKVAMPPRRALAEVWFAPDGRTLAVLRDRTLRFWDVRAKKVRASWKEARKVLALAFSPDSRLVAIGGNEGAVKFRDVATGKERAGFDWQLGAVRAVAFSPDGMLAAAAGEGGRVVVWDVDQG